MINFKPLFSNYEYFQIVKPLGKSIQLKAGENVKAEVIDILPTGGVVLRMKGGILTVDTQIPLQKDTTLLLKILNTPSSENRLKIQLIGILDNKNLTLTNIEKLKIDELLSLLSKNEITKGKILEEAFSFVLRNINSSDEKIRKFSFQLLSSLIDKSKISLHISKSPVRDFLTHIQSLEPEAMEKIVSNSGIFFESKIKNRKFKQLKNDLKNILISKSPDSQLVNDIENYQLLSKLLGGVYTFLPVFWEDLEKGDIFLKKVENRKNSYFCRVNLDFKKLGKISGGIFQFGKEIYINLFIENKILEENIKQNIKQLEDKLKAIGYKSVSARFLKEPIKNRMLLENKTVSLKV